MRLRISMVMATAFCLSASSRVFAWGDVGHRIVAYIAYRELDAGTKKRASDALRAHPAVRRHEALWNLDAFDDEDKKRLNLFLRAATFPDDVRSPNKFNDAFYEQSHFHRRDDHFVNIRFEPPSKDPGPIDAGALLSSFKTNAALVKDPQGEVEKAAVALSWLIHQMGDIHQPLHSVGRVSARFPGGDFGGNKVEPFPNPRGIYKELHAYWDDLPGNEVLAKDLDTIATLGDQVRTAVPRSTFTADELKVLDDIMPWALESFRLAVENVYPPLTPAIDDGNGFAQLPGGYEEMAQAIAKRRLALAGYRLAELLKVLFPTDPS